MLAGWGCESAMAARYIRFLCSLAWFLCHYKIFILQFVNFFSMNPRLRTVMFIINGGQDRKDVTVMIDGFSHLSNRKDKWSKIQKENSFYSLSTLAKFAWVLALDNLQDQWFVLIQILQIKHQSEKEEEQRVTKGSVFKWLRLKGYRS